MKHLLNPRWIILVNILPAALLFIIFLNHYFVIESLLSLESKRLWLKFSVVTATLTGLQLSYVIYCIAGNRSISVFYALINFLAYVGLLYCYIQHNGEIIPSNIPNWMVTSDAVFYPGTFLMPGLAYALFIVIAASSPKPSATNAWFSFLYGIAIPVVGYLFVQIVLPLWQIPEGSFKMHSLIVLTIAASTFFLFFICRAVYMLISLQSGWLSKYHIYWKALITLLLPMLGLCINNGVILNKYVFGTSIFGNFNNPWFYVITTLNSLLLCLPAFKNPYLRLSRFFALVACFPYTTYFFLVFLPYLPLAVIAVIVAGAGFLMLTPLFLFILQVTELHRDLQYLKQFFNTGKIVIGAITSFSLLPLIITGVNLRDRMILNQALNYIYNPDYSATYSIDRKSLLNTLAAVQKNKIRNNFFVGESTPFIMPYYNWLVLDNMILSDTKINIINQIFFGEKRKQAGAVQNTMPGNVKLSGIKHASRFDKEQESWISTLDLELSNTDAARLGGYETEFNLPEGCWISNYYLDIGNRRETAILAEKKSALWVFSQIRNENRDPGIVHYLTGNRVALKVFPFAAKEIRKTGIELIHKEPVVLNLDQQTISLGTAESGAKPKIETVNQTIYIPENEKRRLQLVERKPVYHFIVDISKDHSKSTKSYIKRIKNILSANHLMPEDVRINFTNSFSNESRLIADSDWQEMFNDQSFEGGFYLEGAIKKILVNSYKDNRSSFPVIIVLTDRIENAIIQNDFADFKITYPENPNFYELDENHKLWAHSLMVNPKSRISGTSALPKSFPVFAWPNSKNPQAYLSNDKKPALVLSGLENRGTTPANKRSWLSGLDLHAMWIKKTLHDPSGDSHSLLVKQSFSSGILSPSTSFIVVENKAQKEALLKKQAQVLLGNKNLDPDEETPSMAEPNLLLIVVLLFILFTGQKLKLCFLRKTPRCHLR